MKKIIALVVAIVMMAAMAVPAFAAEMSDLVANEATVGGTTITYGTSQIYTVTIPDAFTLYANEAKEETVTVSDYMLAADKTLTITVASENAADGKWYLVETAPSEQEKTGAEDVEYTIAIKNGAAVVSGGAILTADTTENADDVSVTLVFNTAGTSQVATFQDIITFTATVA